MVVYLNLPNRSNFVLKVDDFNKRYDELIQKGIVIRNKYNSTV
jgi:hypothetical protein